MGARALVTAVASLLFATPALAAEQTSIASAGGVSNLERTCRSFFRVLPYLTHVTTTGVRVNMIPEDSFDLRVSFALGNEAWGTRGIVTQAAATADTRTHLVAAPNPTINTLTAGEQYRYLVECRTSSTSPYQIVQQAYFRTLQTSGAAVNTRVVVVADDHTYRTTNDVSCGRLSINLPNGTRTDGVKMLERTISNIGSSGGDYLVNLGDTASTSCGQCLACAYPRENGTSFTPVAGDADTASEMDFRWEIFLRTWQPIMAFLPSFVLPGNHEGIHGWGGLGAAEVCLYSQNDTAIALTSYQSALGNYNDAYNNGTNGTDFDGDTVLEDQRDGLYFEWASGTLRWFANDNFKYFTDDIGGATGSTQWPGYAARTNAFPPATFGATSPPSPIFSAGTADTYEDNATMGATQIGWFIARAAAKTETFGAVASHRVVGGVTRGSCYFYQRGMLTTCDTDGDGRREIGEALDPDCDGDLMDEFYVGQIMDLRNIQVRLAGHDHFMQICRRPSTGIDYIHVGQPTCNAEDSDSDGSGGPCVPTWVDTSQAMANGGQFFAAANALYDIYDCDEDGFPDGNPKGINNALLPAVENRGIAGAPNGSLNRGYLLLTVTANTRMDTQWIVTDMVDFNRNNDAVVTYGPINP